jgi:threonine aldolase
MNPLIDLRSDTVTRPTKGMLEAMLSAKVGDDVFGDDPTVIELENKAAIMFGKEAALFCPSGTMTNQIAIKVHTQPGDEVICEEGSHVYRYEGGGIALNSGSSVKLIKGDRGRITSEQILECINPDDIHNARTSLVVTENTSNRGGGSSYDFKELTKISILCSEKKLRFHLDGARLFNALAVTGEKTNDVGKIFDSISICLSKGLGAPVGSVLIGDLPFIKQGRRVRKVFGGAMRQAGFLAAAGIYALDHHIDRLTEDHRRAKQIAQLLPQCNFVQEVLPVETNIIIFKIKDGVKEVDLIENLKSNGILVAGFGPKMIRMVTHLDFDDNQLGQLTRTILSLQF